MAAVTLPEDHLNGLAERLAEIGLPENQASQLRSLSDRPDAYKLVILQVAKNIANVEHAEDLRVGDIAAASSEALRKAIAEALSDQDLRDWISSLEDYWDALGGMSDSPPYFLGNQAYSLSQVYIEQKTAELLDAPPDTEPSVMPGRGGHIESVGGHVKSAGGLVEPAVESVQSIGDALRLHRHILVEGGPGLGKTSLLQNIVHRAAEARKQGDDPGFIPVMVQARTLAQQEGSFSGRLRTQMEKQLGARLHRDLPKRFFEERPSGGPTWLILLDGLDEVIGEKTRIGLFEVIRSHSSNQRSPYRFLITSRPLGDEISLLGTSIRRYVLRPFNPAQVTLFAKQWFASHAAGAVDDSPLFLDQIADSHIADLMQFPLLLTMAALLFQKDRQKGLPRYRAALYERFVATLLEADKLKMAALDLRREWEQRFPGKSSAWIDELFEQRRSLFEHLARKQHEEGIHSLSQEGLSFARQVTTLPPEAASGNTDWLRQQISTLLVRSGLVVRSGEVEAFLHPTFREFFVASILSREIDPGGWSARALLNKWFTREWHEIILFVILLWSEQRKSVDVPLRFALQMNLDGLSLAGLALAEGAQVSPALADMIIAELLRNTPLTKRFCMTEPVKILGRLKGRPEIAPRLDAIARDYSIFLVSDMVLMALGELGETGRLRSLLNDRTVKGHVRQAAAHALALLGEDDEAIPFLIKVGLGYGLDTLRRGESEWEAWRAAHTLIELGYAKEGTALLVKLARSEYGAYRGGSLLYPMWSPYQEDIYQVRDKIASTLFIMDRKDDACLLFLRTASQPECQEGDLLNIAIVLAENGAVDEASSILGKIAQAPCLDLYYRCAVARHVGRLDWHPAAMPILDEVIQGRFPVSPLGWGEEVIETLENLKAPIDFKKTLAACAIDERIDPGRRLRAAKEVSRWTNSEADRVLQSMIGDVSLPLWIREEARSYVFQRPRLPRTGAPWRTGLLRRMWAQVLDTLTQAGPLRFKKWQAFLWRTSRLSWASVRSSEQALRALLAAKRTGEVLALLSNPDTSSGIINSTDLRHALAELCPANELAALSADPMASFSGRVVALYALREAGFRNEFRQALTAFIRDRSGDIAGLRDLYIRLFADAFDPEILLDTVRDESLDTAIRVLSAKAALDKGSVDEITQVACSASTDVWTRVRLARLLWTEKQKDDVWKIFFDIAQDTSVSSHVRAEAVSGLGALGKVDELLQISSDPSVEVNVRKEALWSLGDPEPITAGALARLSPTFIETLPLDLRNCAIDACTIGALLDRYPKI